MQFIIKLLLQNARDFSRKKSTLGMEKNYNKIYSSIAQCCSDVSRYPAVVCAVTADKEVWIRVEIHFLGWNAMVGIFHIVWVMAIYTVHTRNRVVLSPVRQVFDVAESLDG